MFDDMEAAVEGLSIPVDGQAIAAVLALRDRLDARIAEAVGEFDAVSLWDADGATSLVAWLRDRGGRTRREAAHGAARANALRTLPKTAAAWAAGELSSGQVDAVLARLSPILLDRFAEHEAAIIPALIGLSISETASVIGVWAARAEADGEAESDPAEPERRLYASRTLGGRTAVDGDLDPMTGELLRTALRLAEQPDDGDEARRTPATRRADALGEICRFFLDHQQTHRGGRHRPHVSVVVDLDDLEARRGGRSVDGEPVAARDLEALLCDSALHRLVRAGRSSILDYGTATRTVPANLWNALVIRDEHCRWPGCDRPSHWCDAHHVVAFVDGGPTSADNLVVLCRRHHRRLHHPGWHAKLLPDGTFEVADPRGHVRSSRPPAATAAAGVAFW